MGRHQTKHKQIWVATRTVKLAGGGEVRLFLNGNVWQTTLPRADRRFYTKAEAEARAGAHGGGEAIRARDARETLVLDPVRT